MNTQSSLEFFRKALELCVRWKRSPLAARTETGRSLTLWQVMVQLGEGVKPPAITESEATMLAGEFPFSYDEIFTGLSARSSSRRATRTTSRRSRGRLATQTA